MEIKTTADFKASRRRDALLHLIENKSNYDLKNLKQGFEALVLNPIDKN